MGADQRKDDRVDLSVAPADEIKTTTCYMCACRCGIRVFLKDGKVRCIEGNRDHPVNKGVLCGKGAAGIMQHYSPARLRAPLLRVGPRGSSEFKEKSDYDALAGDLAKRGWTQADMQLFSDERALARASPEKVCQLVHDWFAAQLDVKDPDMQLRLLVDSLKPVVAG